MNHTSHTKYEVYDLSFKYKGIIYTFKIHFAGSFWKVRKLRGTIFKINETRLFKRGEFKKVTR